jgi:hypothetical protein
VPPSASRWSEGKGRGLACASLDGSVPRIYNASVMENSESPQNESLPVEDTASSDIPLDFTSKAVLSTGVACSAILAIALGYGMLRFGLFVLRTLAES